MNCGARRAGRPGAAGAPGAVHRLARSLGHLTYARRFLAEACAHYEAAAASAPDPSAAAAAFAAPAAVVRVSPPLATAGPGTAGAENESPGPQLAAQPLAAARRSADPVLISG